MSAQTLTIPCWTIAPGVVLGRLALLPDNAIQIVRKNDESVVSALKDMVYDQELWTPDLVEWRSRRFTQMLRPRLVEGRSSLVLPFEIPFGFDVVYGRQQGSGILCELLPFGRVFMIEREADLELHVRSLVREESSAWSVEQLLRWALMPPMRLHTAHVRTSTWGENKGKKRPPPRLSAIAEKLEGGRGGPLDAAFGRETLAMDLALALGEGVNVLMVGEPRVGKSAVLREAARMSWRGRPVWRSSADRLPAGAKYLGEWQKLCDTLVDELEQERATLWVDELPRLLTLGGDTPETSVAAYLLPALAEGRIQLIGEITPAALSAIRPRLPSFFAQFREIHLGELTEGALRRAQEGLAELCQERLGVQVEPTALAQAVRLLSRYAREERFPGKLADFLGLCASEVLNAQERVLSRARVVDTFVRRTGLPAVLVDDSLPLDRAALRGFLESRIAGQPEAITQAVQLITGYKVALNDPRRPVGTLLFAGPTGVGKTATARALAEWTFGQGPPTDPLIRVDMSELQHPSQVRRLIGGDGEAGELPRKVRERPFSVLLLDEIEKAHPVFFDVLLGLLDEGRLTDGNGRVTDFRGAIVIMTTNLGVKPNSSVGFGVQPGDVDLGEIRRFFRPELLNRIDRVVRFHALSQDVVREIARRELASLSERPGLKVRRIQLLFGEALVERVVAAGFDPALGARPLQRAVEEWAVAPLAAWLLAHPLATDQSLILELEGDRVLVV